MKRAMTLVCALGVAVLTSPALQGQAPSAKPAITSDADYAVRMKEIQPTAQGLAKAIKSGSEGDAAKAAARLEELFKEIHAYWDAKKVEDATGFAQNAIAAAQAISKAVAAHDMTAAEEARTKLQSQCMACHKVHREKTETGFIIK
jgi:hypothetical protein